MSEILLFSDIHIATHKNSLKRLQNCLDALRWVFETAIKHNITEVVFLGDLFQDREKIQVLPYQRTYEIIHEYAGKVDSKINLYLLVGNHDMWFADRTDVSSVMPLGAVRNVRIIKDCETLNIGGLNIDFLPFTLNPIKSLEAFRTSNSPLLCGHLSLDGAQLNTFYHTHADVSVEHEGDMVRVDADKFNKWQHVFLGHYHGEQRIKNVEYVGSPLELNFAEAFQQKHIIILDTKTLDTKYVVNDFSPKHLILNESQLSEHNLNNTFIKLQPKDLNSANLIEMKESLQEKYNILSLDFSSPKIQQDDDSKTIIENVQNILVKDTAEMLVEYVKATGTKGLDMDKLIGIGKSLIQESATN